MCLIWAAVRVGAHNVHPLAEHASEYVQRRCADGSAILTMVASSATINWARPT
jgi:hypothetical protein